MATKRKPLFECLECGKKFYTIKAAEKASYGARGCPGCGGVDIDVYVEKRQSFRELLREVPERCQTFC